jgi:proline dehydrogenase
MPNGLLLRLAAHDQVRRLVTGASLTRRVVERFVAGETLADGMAAATRLNEDGMGAILDYLGENVATEAQADQAAAAYLASLAAIGRRGVDAHVSVKLTQLGLDLSFDAALFRLREICAAATTARTRVAIDMEGHEYTDRTIEAYRIVKEAFDHPVLALQAYLKRTEADVEALAPLRPAIRLVKGAYNEPKDIAYGPWKTRDAFRRLLKPLLEHNPYTGVGTHDELMIKEAIRIAHRKDIPTDRFEFQMLYGVRRDLQERLKVEGYGVRVYVPFGEAWYPYLMRRMAERPANLRLFLEALARG